MDPREFFSVNRFLFDAIMAVHELDKKNMDRVAELLHTTTRRLKNQ